MQLARLDYPTLKQLTLLPDSSLIGDFVLGPQALVDLDLREVEKLEGVATDRPVFVGRPGCS
jgi:hypothetical protein